MIRRSAPGAALALALVGCGGPPIPSKAELDAEAIRAAAASSTSAPKPGASGAQAASKPPPEPAGLENAKRFGPYFHLWTAETRDWNGGLLVTKDGDVLSFSGRGLRVHARHDGHVIHQSSACSPVSEDGVAFVSDAEILVVCSDEIRSLSWPKLGSKKLVGLSARVDQAAIGGGLVAVAEDGFFAQDKKGKVHVHDARDGRQVDELVPPAEVESLAISPDGARLFVGTREGGALVRDLRAKRTTAWRERNGGGGARFSPDGRSIFGDFASFEAAVLEIDSARSTKSWHVGSWITAARWLDANTIAATGSDGLGVFTANHDEPARSPIDDLGEGIAVAADASVLCAGGRSGRIACFGKSKPAPSTYATPALSGGSAPSDGIPAHAPPPELDAKLVARSGNRLEVTIDPSIPIEVGSTGTMSKPFSTNVGFALSGWIVIAQVKVLAAKGGKLTLEIVEEKSAMKVNGRPVNHFTPGEARLQLWAPP